MKNYYYKLILSFFVLSTIITLSIGIIFINILNNSNINIDNFRYYMYMDGNNYRKKDY